MIKRKEKSTFESPERLNRLVEGTRINGDIFADSNLRIDGEIKGHVSTASKVVIGENGKITGNLTCMDADIEGVVEGNIKVEGLLILREKSKIIGDIHTSRIQIDEGASFNGKCQMGKQSFADQVTLDDLSKESSVIY
jgi:cytoskeletal protein CcmA (bactofilin family)